MRCTRKGTHVAGSYALLMLPATIGTAITAQSCGVSAGGACNQALHHAVRRLRTDRSRTTDASTQCKGCMCHMHAEAPCLDGKPRAHNTAAAVACPGHRYRPTSTA